MIVIRPALAKDSEAIAEVKRLSATAAYGHFTTDEELASWLAKRADVDFIRDRIETINEDSAGLVLVAELDGTIVGAGLVKKERLRGASADTGYLADVYVYPMSSGVGGKIVSTLLLYSASKWSSVRCFVLGSNKTAVDFFLSQGFEETGRQANQELPGDLVELHRAV